MPQHELALFPIRLHEILWLSCCIACLLAVCDMPELAVLEDTLHLDDSAPSAHKDLGTFTVSVLRNITCHLQFLQICATEVAIRFSEKPTVGFEPTTG